MPARMIKTVQATVKTSRKTAALVGKEPVTDILGGVWLVTLLLALLNLPTFLA